MYTTIVTHLFMYVCCLDDEELIKAFNDAVQLYQSLPHV